MRFLLGFVFLAILAFAVPLTLITADRATNPSGVSAVGHCDVFVGDRIACGVVCDEPTEIASAFRSACLDPNPRMEPFAIDKMEVAWVPPPSRDLPAVRPKLSMGKRKQV